MTKRILVTGCAGFIGSHLCEALLRQGLDVVGVDNMNQYYDPELKAKNLVQIEKTAESQGKEFSFYREDIRDQDLMHDVMRSHRITCVVHLAAMAGVRPSQENPLLYSQVNEIGTLTLLEEARKLGIKRFVFASSSSVYGNNKKVPFAESDPVDTPVSYYAATKRAGELLCHTAHHHGQMSLACLRFFTVYGPRQRPDLAINKFTRLIIEGKKVPIFGDGSKSRDYTYIEDIIHGILKTIDWVHASDEARFEIFNLGESETTDVNQMISYLEAAIGTKADKQYLPEVPGDVDTTFADISKSREVLGYNPQTKITEGIKKYVAWFQQGLRG